MLKELLKNQLVVFQMAVAVAWLAVIVWLFLLIAGIAAPVSLLAVLAYWGSLTIGPLLLLVGSAPLFLSRRERRRFSVTGLVGASIVAIQAVVWLHPWLYIGSAAPNPIKGAVALGFVALVVASVLTVPAAILIHRWSGRLALGYLGDVHH